MKLERNLRKRGIQSQLLIALEYKTGPSTLVEYKNYLNVITININENYRSKRKFGRKKNKNKKNRGLTHISEFFYPSDHNSND